MKKFRHLILSGILSILFSSTVLATSTNTTFTTEVFSDGSYIETIIEEIPTANSFTTKSTKSGSKKSTYKDSSGRIIWTITVNGSFSYNGSSSTCTASSISTTCPNTNWKLVNKSARKSGSSAIASATAKKYVGSTCIKNIDRTVRLTCSRTGTLS